MGIRPAKTCRGVDKRPYTRYADRVQRKNFIGGLPGMRIRQFNMGNMSHIYNYCVELAAEEPHNIRDNAFESARMISNKEMGYTGKDTYFLRIRTSPHNIIRENKIAQGNHADRVSDGMSHSFGKPVGRSALVKKGSVLFEIYVDNKYLENAKIALSKAKGKFGCRTSVKVRKTSEDEKAEMATINVKLIEELKAEEKPTEVAATGATPAATGATATGKTDAKAPAAAGKAPAGKKK